MMIYALLRAGSIRGGGEDEAQADGHHPRREADHRHRQQCGAAQAPHGPRHQYEIIRYFQNLAPSALLSGGQGCGSAFIVCGIPIQLFFSLLIRIQLPFLMRIKL